MSTTQITINTTDLKRLEIGEFDKFDRLRLCKGCAEVYCFEPWCSDSCQVAEDGPYDSDD